MVVGVLALFVGGAAVSYASLKERSASETKDIITIAPIEVAPAESIEPVSGNTQTQSSVKPVNRNGSYEDLSDDIKQRTRLRNEANQIIETQ